MCPNSLPTGGLARAVGEPSDFPLCCRMFALDRSAIHSYLLLFRKEIAFSGRVCPCGAIHGCGQDGQIKPRSHFGPVSRSERRIKSDGGKWNWRQQSG